MTPATTPVTRGTQTTTASRASTTHRGADATQQVRVDVVHNSALYNIAKLQLSDGAFRVSSGWCIVDSVAVAGNEVRVSWRVSNGSVWGEGQHLNLPLSTLKEQAGARNAATLDPWSVAAYAKVPGVR